MIKKITIHCSASKNGKPWTAKDIRKMHMAPPRNWSDIAYHLVIQPDGTVENGRALNVTGSHVKGHNTGNIGICLIGNDKFTRAQFNALRYKLDGLRLSYNLNPWDIYCHYEFDTAIAQKKSCPNVRNVDLVSWYILQDDKIIQKYLIKDDFISRRFQKR